MASLTMGEVVYRREGEPPRIGRPNYQQNAKQYLVAQMFTDAIINQDVRMIQLIINRIDGGLPLDTQIDEFQTLFGDTLNEVLNMEDAQRLKLVPDDTVLMALCKTLFDIASADIYGNALKAGKKRPSTDAKNERDAVVRLILDRCGGRKTTAKIAKEVVPVQFASWVDKVLPS